MFPERLRPHKGEDRFQVIFKTCKNIVVHVSISITFFTKITVPLESNNNLNSIKTSLWFVLELSIRANVFLFLKKL